MMPPRIALAKYTATPTHTRLPFLFPSITSQAIQQCRFASILGSLSDVPSSYNKRIRRGRGPASGKGKTSGRGHKGQKQHGKVPAGFTGGQTPDEVVHGKHGFKNVFSIDLALVNLDKVQSWIDQGRLDTSKPITIREMHKSRLTHGIKDGVKLLARNAIDLRTPIHITVSRASAAAIASVEAAGGTVQTRYYSPTSIRRVIKGETHPTLSLLSQPPPPEAVFPPSGQAFSPSPTTSDPFAPAPKAMSSLENPHTTSTSTSTSSSFSAPPPAAQASEQNLLTAIRSYRYRLPDPASRKDLEYYRDPAHRGYLAYQLREGQGPSLFFKSPREVEEGGVAKKKVRSGRRAGENRLF